jgi:hypothetical protein
MMSKEEVAEIMTYCKEKGISYKSRLEELGIPAWKFFDSKSRYAKEQSESPASNGEFLQLTSGGAFVPMPSFAATTGRGFSKKNDQPQKMMSIELRTPNGTMMRIQGEMTLQYVQAIIQASSGRV